MQGATINEKHIEVIIKQMFSRYKVIDSGDTDLNAGETVKQLKSFGGERKRRKVAARIRPNLSR